jgi:hypothetical protein
MCFEEYGTTDEFWLKFDDAVAAIRTKSSMEAVV